MSETQRLKEKRVTSTSNYFQKKRDRFFIERLVTLVLE